MRGMCLACWRRKRANHVFQNPCGFFMKKPLSTLLMGAPAAPISKGSVVSSTPQTSREAVNRRQLVRITLRDLLRRNAIPVHWLECQMLLVSSRSRGSGLYVHLVIRHWDERLLRYTQAFQTELFNCILRFDPEAAAWVHGIAWRFDVANTCPFPALPPKSTWDADQKPHVAKVPPAPPAGTPKRFVAASLLPAGAENSPAAMPLIPAASVTPGETFEVAQDLAALHAILDQEFGTSRPAPLQE